MSRTPEEHSPDNDASDAPRPLAIHSPNSQYHQASNKPTLASQRHYSLRLLLTALAIQLTWTVLTIGSAADTHNNLVAFVLANTLLAPYSFAWAYTLLTYQALWHLPSQRPWADGQTAPESESLPSIVVIIPCRNEPLEVVQMTIESALALNYPATSLSVIVSDNSDEDHIELKRLRQYIHTKQYASAPLHFIHRQGTEGFKAGNIDLALRQVTSDLVLFLDVDNSVPADLLAKHIDAFRREPGLAFLQLYSIPANERLNTFSLATASFLRYWKYLEFIRAELGGWAFFQGHNCLWRTSALKQISPINTHLFGESILAEDAHMTIRVNRLGMHGRMEWSPATFWIPTRLIDLESMLVRWSYGSLQVLVKERGFLLLRGQDWMQIQSRAGIWNHLVSNKAIAIFPFILLALPQSSWGTGFLLACWLFITILPPACIGSMRNDSQDQPVRPRWKKAIELLLLSRFADWCDLRAMAEFLTRRRQRWVPTQKDGIANKPDMSKRSNRCQRSALKHQWSSFRWPLSIHLGILLFITFRQLLTPLPLAALSAWIPLAWQSLAIVTTITIDSTNKRFLIQSLEPG